MGCSKYWIKLKNNKERYSEYLELRRTKRRTRYRNDEEYREREKRKAREYYQRKISLIDVAI